MTIEKARTLLKKALPFVAALTIGGLGTVAATQYVAAAPCCKPGAACCKPGAACCNHAAPDHVHQH